ncbi:hypothetical protein [Streptomyces sp. TRM68367]|uniref:hypothetical protein n=1 Tax=Streptomyces sp. TRM68367 TaxID=2758415 RepID=UPI00165BCA7C|nr:hypothetical protein [Streptomyces sp. TRM68367]MBC9724692.1 hypothetical protein [Streptomyces sp. TRM68367]
MPSGSVVLRHAVDPKEIARSAKAEPYQPEYGGLGPAHHRTWRGWHHHVPLVTAAQGFLTLRRTRPKAHTPV